jgi:hypothetical protein
MVNLVVRNTHDSFPSSALELLKIIPTSSPTQYPVPTSPTTSDHEAGMGTKHTPLEAGDDVEQPPSKKIKKDTASVDQVPRAGADCKRPQPEIESEVQGSPNDDTSAKKTSLLRSNPPPSIGQDTAKPSPTVIKDEDDDVLTKAFVCLFDSFRMFTVTVWAVPEE